MRTVVITDGKYRSSIAAARALGRAGYHIVITQTRGDSPSEPPVFASRYVSGTQWIDGKTSDPDYADRLLNVLRDYDHPVLLCVGADTLNTVSKHMEQFSDASDFLIAKPEILDALNDKEAVHHRCIELGIAVPMQFNETPTKFPVIIKPHCGEKHGLKAADRYAVARNVQEFEHFFSKMKHYDSAPIVQEKISGCGSGVSLLLDSQSQLLSAICHRRIREYPITGGPSTCCESFYDADMIDKAYRLLQSFGFVGMAMVEFKGDRVLEVNPRIWGSFPMTDCAESPFVRKYVLAASGEPSLYQPCDYKTGVRMRFLLNDSFAILQYLRHGAVPEFCTGIRDIFTAKEALSSREDPAPMRKYLAQYLKRR